MPSARSCIVEPLGGDIVAMAQCMVIDADAFPYSSAQFGLRSASMRAWVAREPEGRVIGFLAGRVRGDVLHVEGVAVHREARRRGVGRALVREAVGDAQLERLRAVVLHVVVQNRAAIALYEGEGFIIRRRLREFYPPAAFGGETDAYEMMLLLSPAG